MQSGVNGGGSSLGGENSPRRTGNFSGQKEEEFELMIDAFKKRLEDSNKAREMSAIKLRPNCDIAWIERLKGQI